MAMIIIIILMVIVILMESLLNRMLNCMFELNKNKICSMIFFILC
jgi:hypothetical protein